MEIIKETVRREGMCWYLDNDYIGQLPHRIQAKVDVRKYLQQEASRRWPGKYIVQVQFQPGSNREKKLSRNWK